MHKDVNPGKFVTIPANRQFLDLITSIYHKGQDLVTRNSECRRLTNLRMTFDTTPLITLRTTAWKLAIREMEWFLNGEGLMCALHPSVRHWWEPWNEDGEVRHSYGKQLSGSYGASGKPFNQINYLINSLIRHPYSRRAVVSTWNTSDMADAAISGITNCHGTIIQCFVNEDNTLDMTMYQRSADVMLGLQHNLIQYWALLQWLAHTCGYSVGEFTWLGGDCHIYKAHMPFVESLLALDKSGLIMEESVPNLIFTPGEEAPFDSRAFTLDGEYEPLFKDKLEMIV